MNTVTFSEIIFTTNGPEPFQEWTVPLKRIQAVTTREGITGEIYVEGRHSHNGTSPAVKVSSEDCVRVRDALEEYHKLFP